MISLLSLLSSGLFCISLWICTSCTKRCKHLGTFESRISLDDGSSRLRLSAGHVAKDSG